VKHSQDTCNPFLVGQEAPLSSALHSHDRFLAQYGRNMVCSPHRKTDSERDTSKNPATGNGNQGASLYP